MDSLTLIKVGGKIVEERDSLHKLLDDFCLIAGHKALVHGGGRSATKIAAQLGVETKMVDGRRITDQAMLDIVTMVYGGLVNKQIVCALQARKANALGLTGADMNIIRSEKRPVKTIDYGFVGDVKEVDANLLSALAADGIIPVLAPLTHDQQGSMLNTNADVIASEAAKAFSHHFRVRLVFCFEKPGVLSDESDDDSVISHITPAIYEELKEQGIVSGGMIPKLDNAFEALRYGVSEVIITQASQLLSTGKGTLITL